MLAVFWVEPAFACSCDRAIASRIADFVPVVFTGKVVKVETVAPDARSPVHDVRMTDQVTTIEIWTVLKGSHPPNPARVFTYSDTVACGYDFSKDVGKVLTVPVISDSDGRMMTSYCMMIDINLPPTRQRPRNP